MYLKRPDVRRRGPRKLTLQAPSPFGGSQEFSKKPMFQMLQAAAQAELAQMQKLMSMSPQMGDETSLAPSPERSGAVDTKPGGADAAS